MKPTPKQRSIYVLETVWQRLAGLSLKNRRSINAEVNIAIENHLKKVSRNKRANG